MRSVTWSWSFAALALALVGCGGGGGTTTVDAAVAIDAAIDAAVDAPVCQGMVCDGVCYDTSTDVDHCGDCTTACATTQVCTDGVCGCPTIAPPAAPSLLQSGTRAMGPITVGFGGILGPTIDAVIAGYPTATVEVGVPYTLVGDRNPPFVGYGYDLDLATQVPKLAYFASAGVVTFTKICPMGFSATLTDATFNQVAGLMDPTPVAGGCTFATPSLTVSFGDVACP
ncbi:MAG: hypothetical protein R3B06_01865 [Kofleriaceae bacterium]